MENESEDTLDKQLNDINPLMKAASKCIEDASSSDLLVQRSTSSRLIGEAGSPGSRVNFDGKTTRFKSNTEVQLIKDRIASCREAYENSGIITNAIDLMVDFALEGIIIVHENKQIERFYQRWMKKVKIPQVIEEIMKSYFVDSNVPVLTFRGKISSSEVNRFKKAVGSTSSSKLFLDSSPVKRRVIPYKYSVLDVLRLHVEGADLVGSLTYEYELEPDDKRRIKNPEAKFAEDLAKIKEAFGENDFLTLVKTGRLKIDPSRISMLFYKKDGYRRWANPYLWRAIDDLRFKKLLRDMDISVAESVINAITIIKLGDTVNNFPATPAMFAKMAGLLKTNTKSPNLIWNDLISIESNYPPVDEILGEAKYEQVNKEIRASIGIPEVVLAGAGTGNYANSFLAVKSLIERLEGARQAVLRWLEEQVSLVAEAMDFKKPPFIKMAHVDLEDKTEQNKLMLDMADRGMISYQTCIEAFGENFSIEVQRMKEEDQFRRRNEKKYPYTLVKTGKYGPSLNAGPVPLIDLLDSETLDSRQVQDADILREKQKVELEHTKNPPKTPTDQGGQGDKGGRPAGIKTPQKKKTTPRNKPQGQNNKGKPSGKVAANASISEEMFQSGQLIFDKVYNSISSAYVKKLKLKDARSLRDSHKLSIYTTIAYIIPQFSSVKEVTKENLEVFLNAAKQNQSNSSNVNDVLPKLTEETVNRVRNLISVFKEKNGYLPTRTEARDIVASAYAIYN